MNRVLTIVMDGVGINPSRYGNALALASTPCLDSLFKSPYFTTLQAHGTAVGLPCDDDIGNSEVGHNALGAGRIFDQGAKLVQNAIGDGTLYDGTTWQELISSAVAQHKTLHFIGLLSDGNVHSHQDHLEAMISRAKKDGVRTVRIHALLDGRDVDEKSAEKYWVRLHQHFDKLNDGEFDAAVASGGGRMTITMDRYEADWPMVQRGWQTHVLGKADYSFASPEDVLPGLRRACSKSDQFLPSFVIVKDGQPIGPILDGDSVILFNFRGDRAIEISRAFTEEDFSHFDRQRWPKVHYAGMMEYDGDSHIPPQFLVQPPLIEGTLSEYLLSQKCRLFACSETQKFGHVTYFWNGNRSGYLNPSLEEYVEIPSDTGIGFEEKPEMKAREITDVTIDRMKKNTFDAGRINLANGDMVGHTGDINAAIRAMEVVDAQVAKLVKAAEETGTILLITADHGNCDSMFMGKEADNPNWETLWHQGKPPGPKTSHTTAPVPLVIVDPVGAMTGKVFTNQEPRTLAHLAATTIDLMGLPTESRFLPSLLRPKG